MRYTTKGLSVMIGMPCSRRDMPIETTASLLSTCRLLQAHGIEHDVQLIGGSSIVEAARTKIADIFLQSRMKRLFSIDADIAWEASDFMKVLAMSSKLEVVGCSYPTKEQNPRFFIGIPPNGENQYEMNKHGCFEVGGYGLGFCCVQRKVIKQLAAKAERLIFPDRPEPYAHIFRCGGSKGAFQGEDMAFFEDVLGLGYKVNLVPTIKLGHVGPHVFRADFMESLTRVESP
jgi:hypothetical protein